MRWINLPKKYVLCRPLGGINDMLCQIQKCLDYAKKHDRTVLVETKSNPLFSENMGIYINSLDERLTFIETFEELAGLSCFPEIDFTVEYPISFDQSMGCFVEPVRNIALTFDFSRAYDEQILLHHQFGGGLRSSKLLSKIEFTDLVMVTFLDFISKMNVSNFVSTHVRNTDYKTNYASDLSRVLRKFESIFLATDSLDVLNFAMNSRESAGLTPAFTSNRVQGNSNLVALIDLLALASGSKLYIFKLEAATPGYSGFSRLAKFMWLVTCVRKSPLRLLAKQSLVGISDFSRPQLFNLMVTLLIHLPYVIFLACSQKGVYGQLSLARRVMESKKS